LSTASLSSQNDITFAPLFNSSDSITGKFCLSDGEYRSLYFDVDPIAFKMPSKSESVETLTIEGDGEVKYRFPLVKGNSDSIKAVIEVRKTPRPLTADSLAFIDISGSNGIVPSLVGDKYVVSATIPSSFSAGDSLDCQLSLYDKFGVVQTLFKATSVEQVTLRNNNFSGILNSLFLLTCDIETNPAEPNNYKVLLPLSKSLFVAAQECVRDADLEVENLVGGKSIRFTNSQKPLVPATTLTFSESLTIPDEPTIDKILAVTGSTLRKADYIFRLVSKAGFAPALVDYNLQVDISRQEGVSLYSGNKTLPYNVTDAANYDVGIVETTSFAIAFKPIFNQNSSVEYLCLAIPESGTDRSDIVGPLTGFINPVGSAGSPLSIDGFLTLNFPGKNSAYLLVINTVGRGNSIVCRVINASASLSTTHINAKALAPA
jgi:hypothetical protein